MPPALRGKEAHTGFSWFETTVNGGVVVLSLLRDASCSSPLPYLRDAAATTLTLIQTAQTIRDNRADFRRLCEDAAALTVVVYESRKRSEDPDGWLGGRLKDAVDSFLGTLGLIAQFAHVVVDRSRIISVIYSFGDGNKIRDFRSRLAQIMNQFESSTHLRSHESPGLIKNMMDNYRNHLNEQVSASRESREDISSHSHAGSEMDPEEHAKQESKKQELEAVNEKSMLESGPDRKNPLKEQAQEDAPSYSPSEQQRLWDKVLAERLTAEEERKMDQDAKKKEQEVVKETLQQLPLMLEGGPEPNGKSPLNERVPAARGFREGVSSHPLPVPSYSEPYQKPEEQVDLWNEFLAEGYSAKQRKAERMAEEEARKKEQEAREDEQEARDKDQARAREQEAKKREQKAVNEKLEQILHMLGSVTEAGQSSQARGDGECEDSSTSATEENKVKMTEDERADRDSRRKDSRNPPPMEAFVRQVDFRSDNSVTNIGPDQSRKTHRHTTKIIDRRQLTTNYGGYTNYGRHAQRSGHIPNNHGPQTTQSDAGSDRQYATSNRTNDSRNPRMNDSISSPANMAASFHQNSGHSSAENNSAASQCDSHASSTPARPDSNTPVIDKKTKTGFPPGMSPGGGAIAYGIEGSKCVLAALARTNEKIEFLKPVADNAIAILCTMREARRGEVDDAFAGLALDACGLAFILIIKHDQIPGRLQCRSDDLAEYLRDIVHPFVQEKISRRFLMWHLNHATDDKKIMKLREKLRVWMEKLGIQTALSIHDKVEEIIGEMMSTQDEACTIDAVNEQTPHRYQANPTESLQNSASNSDGNCSPEYPLPRIIISDDGGSKGKTELQPNNFGGRAEETGLLYANARRPIRQSQEFDPTSRQFQMEYNMMSPEIKKFLRSLGSNHNPQYSLNEYIANANLDNPGSQKSRSAADAVRRGKKVVNRPSSYDFEDDALRRSTSSPDSFHHLLYRQSSSPPDMDEMFNAPPNSSRRWYPSQDPPFDNDPRYSGRDSDRNINDDVDYLSNDEDDSNLPPSLSGQPHAVPPLRPQGGRPGIRYNSFEEELRNLSPEMQHYIIQRLMQQRGPTAAGETREGSSRPYGRHAA